MRRNADDGPWEKWDAWPTPPGDGSTPWTVHAGSAAAATTYARTFKITGGVITRSEKETKSNETIVSDDSTGRTLFGRVDFSYRYAASSGQVAVSYRMDTENDYTKLDQTVVLQAVCRTALYGPGSPGTGPATGRWSPRWP